MCHGAGHELRLRVAIEMLRRQDGTSRTITPKLLAQVNYYLWTSWMRFTGVNV